MTDGWWCEFAVSFTGAILASAPFLALWVRREIRKVRAQSVALRAAVGLLRKRDAGASPGDGGEGAK